MLEIKNIKNTGSAISAGTWFQSFPNLIPIEFPN